jgi:catechol 2,3-dioxygenase-like lactoylglutathione lyase family enzyme
MSDAEPGSRTPRLGAILETSLYVTDLDRSRAFYARVLGFEVFMQDERMCAMGVPGAGVLLLFRRHGSANPSTMPQGTIPAHDGTGTLHLAFAIPRNELESWTAHLAAQDVTVESRITWLRGGTSLYFRDPDDHSVEVATPGLWPNW